MIEVDGVLHVEQRAKVQGGEHVTHWEAFAAVEHYYKPGRRDEPIPLYSGPFTLTQQGKPDRPCHGTVIFVWYPQPRIVIAGSWDQHVTAEDIMGLLGTSNEYWVGPSGCLLPATGVLPPPPALDDLGGQDPDGGRLTFERPTNVVLVGDTDAFDEVTFLIPNGPEIWDGPEAAVATDPGRRVPGHLFVAATGWELTIDPRMDGDSSDRRKELAKQGGHDVTHVGRLRRVNGGSFDDETTYEVLTFVRLALSLATGRTTPCLLPVGWRQGVPVGARWNGAPIDPYEGSTNWMDPTIGNAQLSELLQHTLESCVDPVRRGVIRQAIQFLVTANVDVDVELQVALPISALQMLSFYRFVTDRETMSRSAFESMKGKWGGTDAQVRMLLQDCKIDTDVPAHMQHLKSARDGIDPQRDALATVNCLRNKIIHPTVKLSTEWTIYEWAEAGVVARYYLTLTILNTLGYQGQIYSDLRMPRDLGNVEPVPWATPAATTEGP
ncbi:MAG: hypothetical protein ABI140_06715 [Jatrophihabitantaceae bacterium]